jgi:hypothetical protein
MYSYIYTSILYTGNFVRKYVVLWNIQEGQISYITPIYCHKFCLKLRCTLEYIKRTKYPYISPILSQISFFFYRPQHNEFCNFARIYGSCILIPNFLELFETQKYKFIFKEKGHTEQLRCANS